MRLFQFYTCVIVNWCQLFSWIKHCESCAFPKSSTDFFVITLSFKFSQIHYSAHLSNIKPTSKLDINLPKADCDVYDFDIINTGISNGYLYVNK